MAIVLGLFGAFLSNDILARLAGGAERDLLAGGASLALDVLDGGRASRLPFCWAPCCIPESPRFLVASGKREQARRVFARIGGDADALVRQVEQSLQGEHRPRLSDVIVTGTARLAPVVWVGMGLAAFQQFVGINIIFYYGEVLWKAAGRRSSGPCASICSPASSTSWPRSRPSRSSIARAANRCCSRARPAWR